MKPGDEVTSDDGRTFKIGELVAVQGVEGCTSMQCRRMGVDYTKTPPDIGICMGYHCPKCGEPCSMMGHNCKAAAVLAFKLRASGRMDEAVDVEDAAAVISEHTGC